MPPELRDTEPITGITEIDPTTVRTPPPTLEDDLKALARQLQQTIDRAESAIQLARTEAGKLLRMGYSLRSPEVQRWIRIYDRASLAKEKTEAELARVVRLLTGGGTDPGGGEPPPPPPPGVEPITDPDQLRQLLTKPTSEVISTWGTKVTFPEMRDKLYKTLQGNAIMNQQGVGPAGIYAYKTDPHHMENVWVQGTPNSRWGLMAYGLNGTMKRVYFKDIPDEHGIYNKTCWDYEAEECMWENIGSQGIQRVWRAGEALNPDDYLDPYGDGRRALVKLTRCAFVEVGQPTGGRPSYALSLFEPQHGLTGQVMCDLQVLGCYFESYKYTNHDPNTGPDFGSYGAIMCHAHKDVTIIDTSVFYRYPNRAPIQIWGCGNVVVKGGTYEDKWDGKMIEFDIRGADSVTFEGVKGNWVANVYNKSCPWYSFYEQDIGKYKIGQFINEDFTV